VYVVIFLGNLGGCRMEGYEWGSVRCFCNFLNSMLNFTPQASGLRMKHMV
jgi:hypothetical protein